MHPYGIEYLQQHASRIMEEAGCDRECRELDSVDWERLHDIHDELVELECGDVDLLGRIALCLLPRYFRELH